MQRIRFQGALFAGMTALAVVGALAANGRTSRSDRSNLRFPTVELPPQPDWEWLEKSWEVEHQQAQASATGQVVSLRFRSGRVRKGIVRCVSNETFSIRSYGRESFFNLSELDEVSRTLVSSSAFVRTKMRAKHDEYGRRLEVSYDSVISELSQMERTRKQRLRDIGLKGGTSLRGKITQVLPGGVLLTPKDKWEPVLVVGIGQNLADGDNWSGQVYAAGFFEYITVLGASKKVRQYTTKPPSLPKRVIQEADRIRRELGHVEEEIRRVRTEKNRKLFWLNRLRE